MQLIPNYDSIGANHWESLGTKKHGYVGDMQIASDLLNLKVSYYLTTLVNDEDLINLFRVCDSSSVSSTGSIPQLIVMGWFNHFSSLQIS